MRIRLPFLTPPAIAALAMAALVALVPAGPAFGAPPGAGGVRVVEVPGDPGLPLAIVNSNLAAVTLTITVTGQNAKPDRSMPAIVSVPGPGTFPFTRLLPIKEDEGFGYRVRLDWQFGDAGAKHARRTVYELPFESGRTCVVAQGFRGSFTHSGNNEYAVDFDMPEGTAVRAAREGVVEVMADQFDQGGVDPNLRDRVNFIFVRHPDGTYGEYVHLRKGGVAVKLGDRVRAGDLLGYSGFTGYAQGPHLHFAVFRPINGTERETFPVRFRAREGKSVQPEEGMKLTAP